MPKVAPPVRIARLVVWGESPASVERATLGLEHALDFFEPGEAELLILPGGFLRAPWPKGVKLSTGWGSRSEHLPPLIASAETALETLLTSEMRHRLAQRFRYLSLGIDIFSKPGDSGQPHAELVAIVDLVDAKPVHWTGKSYPTPYQEKALVQVADLRSHLYESSLGRMLVLGCHDLNMFGERGRATQTTGGERRRRCDAMRELAAAFQPRIVLHHPHTVDTPAIWRPAWAGVRKNLPTVEVWTSGVRYDNPDGPARAPYELVLETTRSDPDADLDVVWHAAPEGFRRVNPQEVHKGLRAFVALGSYRSPCEVLSVRVGDEGVVEVLLPDLEDEPFPVPWFSLLARSRP